MRRSLRIRFKGFTLTELLIVMAIVLTLAALIFPAFATLKAEALKAACVSNFRQAQLATMLYVDDYNDRMMMTDYQPATHDPRTDRTWVQLILPYTESFSIFKCPADYTTRPKSETMFDEDLVMGDTTVQFYRASQRSNIGYNYLYLAPVVMENGAWTVEPHSYTEVEAPAQSVLFIDTVYQVNDGVPEGGGSYLAIPPCRYEATDRLIDTFFPDTRGGKEVLAPHDGWAPDPNSTFGYGGAWPWHLGRMTVIRIDGSAKVITPWQLAAGCEVKDNWTGLIQDPAQYIWHLHQP